MMNWGARWTWCSSDHQEDPLGNGVENWRAGTSGITKISHGRGVVGKHHDRGVADGGEKVVETQLHSQQLPRVDGQRRLLWRPKARNDVATKVSTPSHIGRVGPKVEVGRELSPRHPVTKMVGIKPPKQILETSVRPGDEEGGNLPERDGRETKESPEEPARWMQAAAWRTEIRR